MKIQYIIGIVLLLSILIFGDNTELEQLVMVAGILGVWHLSRLAAMYEKDYQKITGRIDQVDEALLRIENDLADLSFGGKEQRLKAQLGDAYLPPEDREEGAYG